MADGHWFFRDRSRTDPPAENPEPTPPPKRKGPKHLRKSGSYAGRIYRPLGESQSYSQPKHRKRSGGQ